MHKKSTEFILKFLIGCTIVLLINVLISHFIYRIDLTEENRYSITDASKQILGDLSEPVFVEIYLAGDINTEFKRFQDAIAETLTQLEEYSNGNIQYTFVDPDEAESKQARNAYYQFLVKKGIQPTTVFDTEDGKRSEKLIFPGASLSYQGGEQSIMLLKGDKRAGAQQAINQSIENLEYEFVNAIKQLQGTDRKKIALLQGHGEVSGKKVAGLQRVLEDRYDVVPLNDLNKLDRFDATIIVKPTEAYSDEEVYELDQFIMKGGKALFFMDALSIAVDSIREFGALAFPYENNLDPLLFKYGVKINDNLLQDINSGNFPVVTGNLGENPQINLLPWPYYVVLNKYADHPIVRNLNAVYGKFVNSIDTVAASGIQKTPLVFTSEYTRVLKGPLHVNFESLKEDIVPEAFDRQHLPVAYLLEGQFTSLYKNRFVPKGKNKADFVGDGKENKIIVVADGDMLVNEINRKNGSPYPLGLDPYSNTEYANGELVRNMLSYLMEEDGLILARNKEVKVRPLNKVKVSEQRTLYQVLNVVLPVILIILFGIARFYWRKRKYARFESDSK